MFSEYRKHYPEASPTGNWLTNPILSEVKLGSYTYLLGSEAGEWECIAMTMDKFDPKLYQDNFIRLMNGIKPKAFYTSIRKGIVHRIDPYAIQRSTGYTIHTLGRDNRFLDWKLKELYSL